MNMLLTIMLLMLTTDEKEGKKIGQFLLEREDT